MHHRFRERRDMLAEQKHRAVSKQLERIQSILGEVEGRLVEVCKSNTWPKGRELLVDLVDLRRRNQYLFEHGGTPDKYEKISNDLKALDQNFKNEIALLIQKYNHKI